MFRGGGRYEEVEVEYVATVPRLKAPQGKVRTEAFNHIQVRASQVPTLSGLEVLLFLAKGSNMLAGSQLRCSTDILYCRPLIGQPKKGIAHVQI